MGNKVSIEFRVIGDDLYFNGDKVGQLTVPPGTERDLVVRVLGKLFWKAYRVYSDEMLT